MMIYFWEGELEGQVEYWEWVVAVVFLVNHVQNEKEIEVERGNHFWVGWEEGVFVACFFLL